MERDIQINLPIAAIQNYSDSHAIKRLSLFGSVLRDDFSPESDVDLLVEYTSDAGITLFDMAQQEHELSAIIGRKVDLRTPHELSRHFRQQVIGSAVLIYG
jgi:uncharacterized protein